MQKHCDPVDRCPRGQVLYHCACTVHSQHGVWETSPVATLLAVLTVITITLELCILLVAAVTAPFPPLLLVYCVYAPETEAKVALLQTFLHSLSLFFFPLPHLLSLLLIPLESLAFSPLVLSSVS